MKINSLSLQNWMVFKGDQKIIFPSNENSNVLVIFGENMRGKTCLLNSLRWCLYGKALNRQKEVMETKKLINSEAFSDGDRHVSVELDFQADNDEYFIKREIDFVEGKNQFPKVSILMKKNNDVIPGGKVEDIIDYLMPEQLSRFFLFDGELLREYEDLVVAEGSTQATKIKQSIEKNLGLPVLTNAHRSLLEIKKKYNRLHTEEMKKNKQLTYKAERLELYEDQLSIKQKELEELEKLISQADQRIVELKEVLEGARGIVELSEKEENLERKLEELDEDIEKHKNELKTIAAKLWRYPLKMALEPQMLELDKEIKKLKKSKEEKMEFKFEISSREQTLNQKACKTCGHEITEDEKQIILNAIEELKPQLIDLNEVSEKLKDKETLFEKLSPIANVESQQETYASIQQNIRLKRADMVKTETSLFEIKELLKQQDQENAREVSNEYDRRVEERGKNKNKSETINGSIEELLRNIDTIKKELELTDEEKNTVLSRQSEMADKLDEIFKKAISLYIDLKRKEIKKRATETFSHLTTENKFDTLEINESYGLNLIIDGKKVNRSAGAEQIVALSLIESLNYLGRRKGPMMMDTPAGRLDKPHRINIMNHLPKLVTQLAIFAHSGELDEKDIYFDKTLIGKTYRLEKVNTFHSEIKEI